MVDGATLKQNTAQWAAFSRGQSQEAQTVTGFWAWKQGQKKVMDDETNACFSSDLEFVVQCPPASGVANHSLGVKNAISM